MNDDRISEVYKGEIWDAPAQKRARDRIHWLAGATVGERVLDLGCSQGIVTILLAREGFTVTGVDIQRSALEYARNALSLELEETQKRATFVEASGHDLSMFEDHCFDTVLLGELLEHLLAPERVLMEVARVVTKDGRVVITTPFGISPHHDHKQTFYPDKLKALLESYLTVQSFEIVDRYFRVIGSIAESTSHGPPISDRFLEELDLDRFELSRSLVAVRREVATLQTDLEHTATALEEASSKLTQGQQALSERDKALADAARSLAGSESSRVAAEARLAKAEQETSTMASSARGLRSEVAQREREVANLRRKAAKLEALAARASYRQELAEWRLESLRGRKWFRLGTALSVAKRRPLRLPIVPFEAVAIAFSESPTLPRPTPPATSEQPKVQSPRGAAEAPPPSVDPPIQSARPAPLQQDVKLAIVADEMTLACFSPECRLLTFRPDSWRETLEVDRPDLLLVESAWRGNGGSWQYKVGSYSHPDSVGLPDLTALVNWCRERGIPTVFWNKEDPVHFERFKRAAGLFDVVLTTDENCVPRYEDLGPESMVTTVSTLQFAAQPVLHNPFGALESRDPRPVFAGTYYRDRHEGRREPLEVLLDAASPFGLVIYDRMHGDTTGAFGFPERFSQSLAGAVPYQEISALYRHHRVFLNTNSVTESPTMFSRRVFELLASGTPVVSTPALGISSTLGDAVRIVDDLAEATSALTELIQDDAEWLRVATSGIEVIAQSHLYADRLRQILEVAGVETADLPHLKARVMHDGLTSSDIDLAHPPGLTGSDWVATTLGRADDAALQRLVTFARFSGADAVGIANSGPGHVFTPDVAPAPLLYRASLATSQAPDPAAWGRAGHLVYAVPGEPTAS